MDCVQIKRLLSEYIDNVLDDQTKKLVDEHLSQCSACSKELATSKSYVKEMSSLKEIKAPDDFLEKVQERINRRFQFERIMRKFFVPVKIKVPLQLAGAVAMLVLVILTYKVIQQPKELHVACRLPVIDEEEAQERVLSEPIELVKKMEFPTLQGVSEGKEPIKLVLCLRTKRAAEEYSRETLPQPGRDFDVSAPDYDYSTSMTYPSQQIQPSSITSGSPFEFGELTRLVQDVRQLTERLEGKFLSVEYEKDTNNLKFINVEIPAKNYNLFLEKMSQLGEFNKPLPSAPSVAEEALSLRIELPLSQ